MVLDNFKQKLHGSLHLLTIFADMRAFTFGSFIFLMIAVSSSHLKGQGTNLPIGHWTYHTLDRIEIGSGWLPEIHSSLKPFGREFIALSLDSLFGLTPVIS